MDRIAVEKSLNYVFTDETWLKQALTHPSVDQKRITNLNYERLEFLGDAVLELVVSRELFARYPKADEGLLTKMRSSIVSRAHLAGHHFIFTVESPAEVDQVISAYRDNRPLGTEVRRFPK